jgi:acyl-CoA thioesterase FadM
MKFLIGIALVLGQPVAAYIHGARVAGLNNGRSISCQNNCKPIKWVRSTASLLFNSNAAVDDTTKEQQTNNTFQSPKLRVYIEDTDAYGVLYNSNYVRAYERALRRHSPLDSSKAAEESTFANRKWVLSSIYNQKFRSSPALGEEYIVRGELVNNDESMQTWDLELVTESESGAVIHNSARVTMTSGRESSTSHILDQNGKIDEKRYTPYNDEFDHHNFDPESSELNYYIPLRNAMNFFERSRSDFLGGPDALRKMQVDDDLIWVVTGVENGKLFTLDEGFNDISVKDYQPEDEMQKINVETSDDSAIFKVTPGKDVIVQTAFDVKRRGMILDCHHTLWMHDGMQKKKLLAQATCVIVALKGSTRRPTSKLPQWVLDKFA